MSCEICRENGISGRESFQYRFVDGQRVSLCLSHARVLRMTEPKEWRPIPHGKVTREAEIAVAIIGECA